MQSKTVFITGASKGFGKTLAQTFWQQGANLILLARSKSELEALADELQKNAQQDQALQIIACDVRDVSEEMFQEQKIDVLINCAAIQGPIGVFENNDWSDWQETLAIDLLAPAHLIQIILPQMKQRKKGKIINLSGGGATGCRPNFSAYAVAKIGLVKLTETLAKECEAFNIDINCVAPGVMATQMLQDVLSAGIEQAGTKEHEVAEKAFASEASAMEKAAQLCLYLASSQSDGVSGKIISAVWDDWANLHQHLDELKNSDIYTLRRVVPVPVIPAMDGRDPWRTDGK